MTQEQLSERAGLSPDTIRRLEHGSFSPSRDTLVKLCAGLDILVSTLFLGYELGERDSARELVDLVTGRQICQVEAATSIVRLFLEQLDRRCELVDDATV